MSNSLGIFVRRFDPLKPDAPQSDFLRKLASSPGAFVFDCLSFDGVSLDGWHYDGGWQSGPRPVPSVVYDRCFSGSSVIRHTQILQFRNWLEVQGVRWINSPAASRLLQDKVVVADILAKHGLPVPEFERYVGSAGQLQGFLGRHPHAYIKPVGQMQGHGVMRLVRESQGKVSLWSGSIRRTIRHGELPDFLSKGDHILQAAVGQPTLALSHAHPHVLKVLVQRGKESWQAVGCEAIVNASSVANDPFKAVLAHLGLPSGHSEYTEQACLRLAQEAGKALQLEIPGDLNEASLDFVLDRDGNPFILEANSKPGKANYRSKDVNFTDTTVRLIREASDRLSAP